MHCTDTVMTQGVLGEGESSTRDQRKPPLLSLVNSSCCMVMWLCHNALVLATPRATLEINASQPKAESPRQKLDREWTQLCLLPSFIQSM
jgi:hypothetical protein